MSRFTKDIAEILADAAAHRTKITYGAICDRLRKLGKPVASRGIGNQLVAVHRVLLDHGKASGNFLPPLTAIAEDRTGIPGNRLTAVLAQWLASSGAYPAMVADAKTAAAAGAAPPGHVLRFAQNAVFTFDGWYGVLATIPTEAFEAARAGPDLPMVTD